MSAAIESRPVPGPRGYPLVGILPELWKDPLGFLRRVVDEHGDVVRLRVLGNAYIVNRPEYVKHVLQEKHLNYTKGPLYDPVRAITGNGLLTSVGDFWLRQRRLVQPSFHREVLSQLGAQMVAAAGLLLQRFEDAERSGRVLDLQEEMSRVALTVVGSTFFGSDLAGDASQISAAIGRVNDIANDWTKMPPFLARLPTPQRAEFNRNLKQIDDVVFRLIAERRSRPGEKRDLLAMLMETEDADTHERMNDRQLRDEAVTMLIAATESTATALTWTFYLLALHPEAEARARRESREVLGDSDPSMAQLPKLQYVSWAIQEAMRLYPPLAVIGRTPIEDDVLDGYRLLAGSTVYVCPYLLHRHPEHWSNPYAYDPTRFAPEEVAKRHRFAYVPFAAGPRQCIGNQFALMEMQIVTAMILRRFRVELLPWQQVEPELDLTLHPAEPIRVRIAPAPRLESRPASTTAA